jgi:hypothetical protein
MRGAEHGFRKIGSKIFVIHLDSPNHVERAREIRFRAHGSWADQTSTARLRIAMRQAPDLPVGRNFDLKPKEGLQCIMPGAALQPVTISISFIRPTRAIAGSGLVQGWHLAGDF